MIKVLKVKCNNEFYYCKRTFEIDKLYKAYVNQDGGYIVFNNNQRVFFDNRRPGQFKSDNSIKDFKANFEVVSENLVRNKKELNNYLID